MPLSHRLSVALATILGAVALVAAAASPTGPKTLPAKGPLALRDGQEITFTTPQFVVQALWFKANDETGWYWTGSDEVYAIFSDMDPTHTDRTTSEYDDVDEGDTVNFKATDSCMAPQPNCDRGMADLNVRFSFWEADWAAPLYFSYCNKPDSPGIRWRLQFGICIDDDFIGSGEIIYSRAELVAMLPAVGNSREFTAVMDKDAGKYRFRYRITRIANAERSIVIHLPDIVVTPAISLQVMIVTVTEKRIQLTWSGATGANVDIYRNGVKALTTPNDGIELTPLEVTGTYQYRLCEFNSTTACSPDVTLVVP
jgi:hypothetical protein